MSDRATAPSGVNVGVADAPAPIRQDLAAAYRAAWEAIAEPGTWWTGAERVAIAGEVRSALDCALCAERKAALSPFSVDGEHVGGGVLSPVAQDAVHRIVTDATRLTGSWVEKLAASGISDAHYVELLAVTVTVLSIDEFHRAMGLALEPLPSPRPGEPSRVRPPGAEKAGALVPMLSARAIRGTPNDDLYDGAPVAMNVIAALSLVPDGVRLWRGVGNVQYLPPNEVANPRANGGRALTRAQIELVAGRVSAVNECFY